MVLEPGKIYTPASAEEIRDDFLADWRLEARKYADVETVDRATRPGGDEYLLASAMGNLGLLQYANIAQSDIDSDERTATGQRLDVIRESLGLPVISASPSTGRVVVFGAAGTVVSLSNHQFVLPNGKRGRVDGIITVTLYPQNNPNAPEVPVVTIDTGADTNAASGTVVKFVSPPSGMNVEARVSVSQPLSGGENAESDGRKRDRISNRRKNVPAGGNWAHAVEIALGALGTVQGVWVYPALGGPGSAKVAIARDYDDAAFLFTRELNAFAVKTVRDAIHAAFPDQMELVVQSVADQATDVALQLSLPPSVFAGGNGLGWSDSAPWPPLAGGDTKVTIASVSGSTIEVDASTSTAPVAGQTHVMWWSSVDQKFFTRLVTAQSGSSGSWTLTLDAPLVAHDNSGPVVGEYISPDASRADSYGKLWRGVMRRLGPGENTVDANRVPRALRHPFPADDWPSNLGARAIDELLNASPEISDAAWSYRSFSAPTTPGAVVTAPNVLVPNYFGIYPL
jgi:hypothetical protein